MSGEDSEHQRIMAEEFLLKRYDVYLSQKIAEKYLADPTSELSALRLLNDCISMGDYNSLADGLRIPRLNYEA